MIASKHFPLPLFVKFINGKVWELTKPFEYITKKGETITIPKGFLTDFASIPRFVWSFIGSPTGRYGPSAIVHDHIYHTQMFTRKKADHIFYEAMGILGVAQWKRWLMWKMVRMFGGFLWKKHK